MNFFEDLKKKSVKIVLGISLAVLFLTCFAIYQIFFSSNIKREAIVYIPFDATYEEMLDSLRPHLKNEKNFKWLSALKKFKKPRAGHYLLKKGLSNKQLVNKLRAGNQDPIKLTLKPSETLDKFCQKTSKQLAISKEDLCTYFLDSLFIDGKQQDKETILQLILPDTYEVYWTISPESLRKRLQKEYKNYWNENRKHKAKKLGLSPLEVTSLAAIVQKEVLVNDEKPRVAGLYLNRLKKGMKLESDPTVIYALKQKIGFDTIIRRVLYKDLTLKSPFNTYQNIGLPPAPIVIANKSSIDGVLNAEKNDYIFMCASTTNKGYHEFAKSYSQHLVNARKYTRYISQMGIKR